MELDARMSRDAALVGVAPDCPEEILAAQVVVDVEYPSPDGPLRRGQVVVHRELAADVVDAFGLIVELGMPVGSAIPLADERFWRDGVWSDDASMEANNSSAFNFRFVAGTQRLSHHATGRALDINPLWNPMFKNGVTYPPAGTYDPDRPGTFHADHAVVQFFEARGWEWGGRWESPWDLHHFQKP